MLYVDHGTSSVTETVTRLFLKRTNMKTRCYGDTVKISKNILIICFSISHFKNISQELLPYQLESLVEVQYSNQLIPLIDLSKTHFDGVFAHNSNIQIFTADNM